MNVKLKLCENGHPVVSEMATCIVSFELLFYRLRRLVIHRKVIIIYIYIFLNRLKLLIFQSKFSGPKKNYFQI